MASRRWSTSSRRGSGRSAPCSRATTTATRSGIGAYGGGQTELGPGRGHIQYLASVFHPDTPNDTAPSGYNDPELATKPGLETSPLDPKPAATGFRRDG